MKKIIILFCAVLLLCGCGESSVIEPLTTEPVNVEKYHCGESIKAVFEDLGEAYIVEDPDYKRTCTFYDVNLWGYNGTLVFDIREDEETIRRFSGAFKIGSEQLEPFLLQFVDKYGDYTKHGFSDVTTYSWRINEDDAGNYDEIKVSDRGKKGITVTFSNQWSDYSDENYNKRYKYDEDGNEIIATKEFLSDEQDLLVLTFSRDKDGNYNFKMDCEVTDERNLFSLFLASRQMLNGDKDSLTVIQGITKYSFRAANGTRFDYDEGQDAEPIFTISDGTVITYDDYVKRLDELVGWNDSTYGIWLIQCYYDLRKDYLSDFLSVER